MFVTATKLLQEQAASSLASLEGGGPAVEELAMKSTTSGSGSVRVLHPSFRRVL